MLKGRDQHVAAAALWLGLKTRLVPYLVETCAEERWALAAHPGTTQEMMFRRGRLKRSTLESQMPVTVDPDNDGVTWVVVPRLDERRPLKDDAATEFLGEVEYSSTGYFGDEGGVLCARRAACRHPSARAARSIAGGRSTDGAESRRDPR